MPSRISTEHMPARLAPAMSNGSKSPTKSDSAGAQLARTSASSKRRESSLQEPDASLESSESNSDSRPVLRTRGQSWNSCALLTRPRCSPRKRSSRSVSRTPSRNGTALADRRGHHFVIRAEQRQRRFDAEFTQRRRGHRGEQVAVQVERPGEVLQADPGERRLQRPRRAGAAGWILIQAGEAAERSRVRLHEAVAARERAAQVGEHGPEVARHYKPSRRQTVPRSPSSVSQAPFRIAVSAAAQQPRRLLRDRAPRGHQGNSLLSG